MAIVDYNHIQLDGFVKDIMDVEPLADKWRAFGWHIIEVDGHDIPALQAAFAEAAATKGKPTAIIAHTIKGKGVSFMENNPKFHGTAPTPDEVEARAAGVAIMPAKTKFELKLGLATREAFGKALVELGRENPTSWCATPIFPSPPITRYFAKEFPDRFFECGIAEANMVAIGAGLASAGKIPFVASFSCFVMNKGFEQLRVTVAYPERQSEGGGHAQRHLDRRRRTVADEHRRDRPGLLAARFHGALAGRRSVDDGAGARRGRARGPGVHSRRAA